MTNAMESEQKKHPHIIYRYQTNRPAHGECGNSDLHEWALRHYTSDAGLSRLSAKLTDSSHRVELAAPDDHSGGGGGGDAMSQSLRQQRRHQLMQHNNGNKVASLGAVAAKQLLAPIRRPADNLASNYKLPATPTTILDTDECKGCDSFETSRRNNQMNSSTSAATTSSSDSSSSSSTSHILSKRDVSLSEKYIELGLVLSQDIFDKRNTSTRLEVLHDAIQIVNCLDLYFRSANTRVSIVYLETWAHGDQIEISPNIRQTLENFLDYTQRKLYRISLDATHLLTGGHLVKFHSNKVGISIPGSICTSRAVSISQETSVFEPFVAASTMVHMLGHNLGMEHDDPSGSGRGGGAGDNNDDDNNNRAARPIPPATPDTVDSDAGQQQQQARSRLLQTNAISGDRQPPPVTQPIRSQAPQMMIGQQPQRNPGPPQVPAVVASGEMHGDEHDDEIRGRSLVDEAPNGTTNDELADCSRGNCLMSGRFNYLEAPISFGYVTIIQANKHPAPGAKMPATAQETILGGGGGGGGQLAATLVLDSGDTTSDSSKTAPDLWSDEFDSLDDNQDNNPNSNELDAGAQDELAFGTNYRPKEEAANTNTNTNDDNGLQQAGAGPTELGAATQTNQQRRRKQLNRRQRLFVKAGLPFRFSRASLEAYWRVLRQERGICLFNKPNQLEDFKNCGNGIVDEGEECDCGRLHECLEGDSCCDPRTCRFKADAQCTGGACCDRCRFRPRGFACRRARGECDLAETCSGSHGNCPADVFKQNGWPCGGAADTQQPQPQPQVAVAGAPTGYCYQGQCPRHDQQCAELWGSDASNADRVCYSSFNLNGTRRGNCGIQANNGAPYFTAIELGGSPPKFRRCEHQNMLCGTLQCQLGNMEPLGAGAGSSMGGGQQAQAPPDAAGQSAASQYEYSNRTLVAADGRAYNCKAVVGWAASSAPAGANNENNNNNNNKSPSGRLSSLAPSAAPSGAGAGSSIGYVREGTKCATNKVCLNKTCQPLELAYRDAYELCPRDERGQFCSGQGVCSTANRCHCQAGWMGHDCSQPEPLDVVPSTSTSTSTTTTTTTASSLAGAPPNVFGAVVANWSGQQLPVVVGQIGPHQHPMQTRPANASSMASQQLVVAAAPLPLPLPTAATPEPIAETTTTASSAPSTPGTSNIQVQDNKRHNAMSAPTLVVILVTMVGAVYIGFVMMANCYRRKGFLKPDKVLRHHQMNCKLDALRLSFIAKRLADAEVAAALAQDGQTDALAAVHHQQQLDSGTIGSELAPTDLMSPFVSPGDPALGAGAGLPASLEASYAQYSRQPPGSFFDQLPYANPAIRQQQQQQLIQADIHQSGGGGGFCQMCNLSSSECLHPPTMQTGQLARKQQRLDSSSVFGLGGAELETTGDHIPLLLGATENHKQHQHHHHLDDHLAHQHHKCIKNMTRPPMSNGHQHRQQQKLDLSANSMGRNKSGASIGNEQPTANRNIKQQEAASGQQQRRHNACLQPTTTTTTTNGSSSSSGQLHMNRATSLGNVNGGVGFSNDNSHNNNNNNKANQLLGGAADDDDDDDNGRLAAEWRTTSTQTRALATPSRAMANRCPRRAARNHYELGGGYAADRPTAGRQHRSACSSFGNNRRELSSATTSQAHLGPRLVGSQPLDSCSAPSSPEHYQHHGCWNASALDGTGMASNSSTTMRSTRLPILTGQYGSRAANLNYSEQQQPQQLIAIDHQHLSHNEDERTSNRRGHEHHDDDDDDAMSLDVGPLLPPPPPPRPPRPQLVSVGRSQVDEDDQHDVTGHESDDDDANSPDGGHSQRQQQRTSRRPNTNNSNFKQTNRANYTQALHQQQHQDNLSLINQLQQHEQVLSLHQKQIANATSDVGLHEFFSLPFSVQLSALLARSLAEQQQQQQQQQQSTGAGGSSSGQHHQFNQTTPIDEYLNALNSTHVAAYSRRSFKGSSGQLFKQEQQQQQQQQQQANAASNSRGGTMPKQQMKLQNLQSLIARLQKLHNQTILQHQLDELNGEINDADYEDDDAADDRGLALAVGGGGANYEPASSRQSTLGRSGGGGGGGRSRSFAKNATRQASDDLIGTINKQQQRNSHHQLAGVGRRTTNNTAAAATTTTTNNNSAQARRLQATSRQNSTTKPDGTTTSIGIGIGGIGAKKNQESVYSMSDSEDGGGAAYMARMLTLYDNKTTTTLDIGGRDEQLRQKVGPTNQVAGVIDGIGTAIRQAAGRRRSACSPHDDDDDDDDDEDEDEDDDQDGDQVTSKQTESTTTPTISTDTSSQVHNQQPMRLPSPPPPLPTDADGAEE